VRIFVAHPSALLTDHAPHGDGLVAHGLIRALAQRGHELHVAAAAADLSQPMPDGVHIHVLGRGGGPEAVRRLAFMRRMRRLFLDLRARMDFDVIHQLNPVDAGLSLALADVPIPLVLGPYVPAWPATGPRPPGRRIAGWANRAARSAQERRASALLLSTPAAASKLGARPGRDVLVRELPQGIDPLPFSTARPGEGDDGRTVTFLANLEVRKGIFVLLDAFTEVVAQCPDARLVVAGGGSAEPEVRARAGHGSRIELTGPLPRAAVPALLGQATVYCLPSFGEPFGMSALEAMACGRPLVVTDAGGLGHLVAPAGGVRVPVGDAGALARAIVDLLGAPQRRREMGAFNQARVGERYAWERVVAQLEEVYADVVATRRR
jgi:glycosyltransferase involved in cell wall biosynthesis